MQEVMLLCEADNVLVIGSIDEAVKQFFDEDEKSHQCAIRGRITILLSALVIAQSSARLFQEVLDADLGRFILDLGR